MEKDISKFVEENKEEIKLKLIEFQGKLEKELGRELDLNDVDDTEMLYRRYANYLLDIKAQ